MIINIFFFISAIVNSSHFDAMGTKRKEPEKAASYEWNQEASSTFSNGSLSAVNTQRLVLEAQNAGAQGAEALARAGKSGQIQKNVHRDLTRHMLKNSHWPKYYYAKIPVWDPIQECSLERLHPFLLPHEWLAKAINICDFSAVYADVVNHSEIAGHIQQVAMRLESPWEDFIPLGFHSDGVPYGSQMFYSDSLELFSLNLPCGSIGMRIPFTSAQKNHLVKHETYNAILEVLSWSLKHLAWGTFPITRHDGTAFDKGETWRSNLGNKLKPAKALLVEVRADWSALKQVFQFPQQNENAGICWMCHATPSEIRDCSATAGWRTNRWTAMSFHNNLKETNKVCPLWSVPGVSCKLVVVDWLHCADIGVTADVIGNILLELVDGFPGAGDRNVKLTHIWQTICAEYDAQGVPSTNRFHSLRLKSFFTSKKSPKLKGKAAHIRYFVPVIDCVVKKTMQPNDNHTGTVMSCMAHLAACYTCLQDFDAAKLDFNSRRMAVLYCALEKQKLDAGIKKRWKVKPKLHLFLELCSHICLERHRGNPRNFWTYADESHGGDMRGKAVARGGQKTSRASACRVLNMWTASNDMQRMMG